MYTVSSVSFASGTETSRKYHIEFPRCRWGLLGRSSEVKVRIAIARGFSYETSVVLSQIAYGTASSSLSFVHSVHQQSTCCHFSKHNTWAIINSVLPYTRPSLKDSIASWISTLNARFPSNLSKSFRPNPCKSRKVSPRRPRCINGSGK
jgi:hypothetical protein